MFLIRQNQAEFEAELRKSFPHAVRDASEILRQRDRLSSVLQGTAQEPILLQKTSHLVKLLLRHTHAQAGHAGTGQTLAKFRQRFWIKQGRQAVRAVTQRCVTCKKLNALPFRQPDAGQMPEFRATRVIPFETCGIDYFGPIQLSTPRRRSTSSPEADQADEEGEAGVVEKAWGLLFSRRD